MNRREVIASLALPFLARGAKAQQSSKLTIGLLLIGSPHTITEGALDDFRKGLAEYGLTEGKDVNIEYRWAGARPDSFPALFDDLIEQHVSIIVAIGVASTLNQKILTTKIPIAYAFGGDPLRSGLVKSYGRPGGNVTGVYWVTTALDAKRFEFLSQFVPRERTIAVLVNRRDDRPQYLESVMEVETVAQATGRKIVVVSASTEEDVAPAFATMLKENVAGIVQTGTPFFSSQKVQLVALAERHAIPAIWEYRSFATLGGLMSYGPNVSDLYRRMGLCAGKLLRGANPAELPIDQAVKFELVLNLKTARTLGMTFPVALLGRAEEAIE